MPSLRAFCDGCATRVPLHCVPGEVHLCRECVFAGLYATGGISDQTWVLTHPRVIRFIAGPYGSNDLCRLTAVSSPISLEIGAIFAELQAINWDNEEGEEEELLVTDSEEVQDLSM